MSADTPNAQAEALADARRELNDYADGHVSGSHARFVRCREDVARALGVPWETPEALGPAVPEPPGWGPLVAAVRAVVAERDAYRKAKAENDERFMLERDEARRGRDDFAKALDDCRAMALGEIAVVDGPFTGRAEVVAARMEVGRLVRERDALRAQLAEAKAAVTALAARLAEAEATLANERGEGEPPEPGWQCVSSTIWNIGCGGQPGYASVSRGTERGCPWHWYAGGFEGVETTARAAIRAASERLRGSS